jgi:putative endonuclease
VHHPVSAPVQDRPVRTPAQRLGDDAETSVADALIAIGWTILGRQVRAGRGELDIVAVDPGPPRQIVIVEVRWRRTRAYGLPEETLDWRKRAHLRAAIWRLAEDGLPSGRTLPAGSVRVDLVVVEPDGRMRHHRGIAL